jgi:hypothetical protein
MQKTLAPWPGSFRRLQHTGFFENGGAAMVLHRDIYWLGKQWAVTGYGIQAVNKKLDMKFDIEAIRIWDENLADAMMSEHWFDSDDFAEAVDMARKRAKENPLTFRQVLSDEK